jgi:hypothetical protein
VFTRLFFSDEIPLIRAVIKAGIPTLGVVASWDNLTSKGLLLPKVDRLLVWNDAMREEAVKEAAGVLNFVADNPGGGQMISYVRLRALATKL